MKPLNVRLVSFPIWTTCAETTAAERSMLTTTTVRRTLDLIDCPFLPASGMSWPQGKAPANAGRSLPRFMGVGGLPAAESTVGDGRAGARDARTATAPVDCTCAFRACSL